MYIYTNILIRINYHKMDTKVAKLQSRRMIYIKKNLKEIKFSKLKSKFFSNLREELIKKGWKMPKVQKKLESF